MRPAWQRRPLVVAALFATSCGMAGLPVFHCQSPGKQPPLLGPAAPACPTWSAESAPPAASTRFAVIGDYGDAGPNEMAVSVLVKQWKPAFILTTGDNNYPRGEAATIDANIGAVYHEFIAPYLGRFGCGGDRNRFFPSLGNHDWIVEDARPYLEYFQLPGNERYYDSVWGDVHFFALDSDGREPDGTDAWSAQARWLRERLAASTARWQVVTMHHPPYSSGPHGPSLQMRWPFKEWGADLVLAGHDHIYERLTVDGLSYVVDGLGGASFYPFGPPLLESQVRFTGSAGALLIDADVNKLHARFETVDGRVVDDWTIR